MSLSELSKALKAQYSVPLSDLIPKDVPAFMKFSMSFAQALAESTTGRVRRVAWSKEYHNCHNVYLHYLQVGDLDKTYNDWIPERDARPVFTFPLQL
jgi:hypothetical protein